jgi:hypothetical protein
MPSVSPQDLARGSVAVGAFGFGSPEDEAEERAGSGGVRHYNTPGSAESAAQQRTGSGSVRTTNAPESPEDAAKGESGADQRRESPVQARKAEDAKETAENPDDEAQGEADADASVRKPKV